MINISLEASPRASPEYTKSVRPHLRSQSSEALNALANKRSKSSGLNVLLTEDNLINQKLLQRQLSKADCTVTVANNGQEALDVIMRSQFVDAASELALDVVLLGNCGSGAPIVTASSSFPLCLRH